MPSPYHSDHRARLQLPPPTADLRPHQAYYRPSAAGNADVFLFSPTLCSRSSKDSISQSSRSFDGFSYTCSPASDLRPSPRPPSPTLLPVPRSFRSPLFVEAYLSGIEPQSIARDSPGTPFQQLFNSSPTGYWQGDHNSLSPISRNSSTSGRSSKHPSRHYDTEDPEYQTAKTKIQSLLDYQKTHSVPDSPAHRPSTPSSLSSLSSFASSPSALSYNEPHSSSQTSCGPTPSFSSPRLTDDPPPSLLLSSLGSPIKLAASSSSGGSSHFDAQRNRQKVSSNRSLAAEILNQLGQSRGRSRLVAPLSSVKRPHSPPPVLDRDSDGENHDHSDRKNRKRARTSKAKPLRKQSSSAPANRNRRLRISTPVTVSASSSVPPGLSACHSGAPNGSSETECVDQGFPNRTFPLRIPIHSFFPLFYRRFPVSSAISPELAATNNITMPIVPEAALNQPRDAFDLYTPRFVKGKGTSKAGLCPICFEHPSRGGEGKKLWLSMKFSAFKWFAAFLRILTVFAYLARSDYHMQYYHGISATTGRPFSPPTAFRTVARMNPSKHEKAHIMEGKCHKCRKWVAIEGVKDVEAKVREIFWWKHAAGCHQGDAIEGEGDVFIEDSLWAVSAGISTEMHVESEEMGGRGGGDESED